MSDFNNRFKSAIQDWETPNSLFDKLNSEFKFDIDIAASEINKKCDRFFSQEDNAMSQIWEGVGWLNPPYGDKGYKLKDWVKKSYHEALKDNCTIVMLIPARTNTMWWHDYCMKAYEVRFIKGRPKFKGGMHGLPLPSALVVFKKYSGDTKFSSYTI